MSQIKLRKSLAKRQKIGLTNSQKIELINYFEMDRIWSKVWLIIKLYIAFQVILQLCAFFKLIRKY